jgi:hypothetical protein
MQGKLCSARPAAPEADAAYPSDWLKAHEGRRTATPDVITLEDGGTADAAAGVGERCSSDVAPLPRLPARSPQRLPLGSASRTQRLAAARFGCRYSAGLAYGTSGPLAVRPPQRPFEQSPKPGEADHSAQRGLCVQRSRLLRHGADDAAAGLADHENDLASISDRPDPAGERVVVATGTRRAHKSKLAVGGRKGARW